MNLPAGMWFVVGVAVFASLMMFVVIPLIDWWYDWDRRPARFHPDGCSCGNCNDYFGSDER